ncbi:major facilitator superfamily domain-containing protein [Aspergillus ambiguus]|uniref:major facilitator superfamily domain-containing protein n=1 Tax=Aspergillus ambiguus TaxID=176160 RepID=UPI003CCD1F1E
MTENTPEEPKTKPTAFSKGEEPPYHILSKKQKWNLVILVSLAGSFSPFSSNIYFPAIETITSDIGVDATLVALTITVYMVVQGIAPSLFAAISDAYGRRLTFAISLSIYTAGNPALAFISNYPIAGAIADIAYPGERGGFMGTNAGLRMTGKAIGPILGGALNNVRGFRSIFWFLFSLSVIFFGRNGSIPLSGFQKPIAYIVKAPTAWSENNETHGPPKPRALISCNKAFSPLKYILGKDIGALLAWGAVAYKAWSMVTSSTTTTLLYSFLYLTQWQIGLCFLPNGLGYVCGSLSTGWLLDQSFKHGEEQYKRERAVPPEENVLQRSDFPVGLIVSLALYGPSFELNDLGRVFDPSLAAPLVLRFIIAFTSTSIFNVNSTVLIDCFPDRPASVTALNNLCRCLLGAGRVGAIQPLIGAVKVMKAFFIVTGVVVLCTPFVWIQWKWGEKWRREREERLAPNEE